MKSDINFLSQNQKSFSPILRERIFVSLYALVAIISYIVCLSYVDVRRDDDLSSAYYLFESILLIGLTISSSILSYRLLSPGKNTSTLKKVFFISLGFYFTSLFVRIPKSSLANQFLLESDISRGGCGVIISILSLGVFVGLYNIFLKKGLIFKKGFFSFTLACATCSLGTLLMQVICEHESVAHVLVYHTPPFLAFGLIFYCWQKLKA